MERQIQQAAKGQQQQLQQNAAIPEGTNNANATEMMKLMTNAVSAAAADGGGGGGESTNGLLLQQIQLGITAFWLMQQQQQQRHQQSPAAVSASSSSYSSSIFPKYCCYPPLPPPPSSSLYQLSTSSSSSSPFLSMPMPSPSSPCNASVTPMPTLVPECSPQQQKQQETTGTTTVPPLKQKATAVAGTDNTKNIDGEKLNSSSEALQNVDPPELKALETGRIESAESGGKGMMTKNAIGGASNNNTNNSAVAVVARPPMLDKHWQFVSEVASFAEFEQLRCVHQVSRNRTFAYGIRYSCTQKTQLRCNCPYLLVCIFADGAGEHSAPGVGRITVFSRNAHTHPVKTIKRRLPRSLARQAKREREEIKQKMKAAAAEARMVQMPAEKTVLPIKVPTTNSDSNNNSPAENGTATTKNNNVMNLLAELSEHFASSTNK